MYLGKIGVSKTTRMEVTRGYLSLYYAWRMKSVCIER